MTDDELRNAIGNAKGCTFEYVRKSSWGVEAIKYNSPKFRERWIKSGDAFLWPCSGMFNNPCPDWPRDIAAAWELVEELRGKDCAFEMITAPGDWGNDDANWPKSQTRYECEIYTRDCPEEFVYVQADTAPRAICLAYLAWKGVV